MPENTMLQADSTLRPFFGPAGVAFLEFATQAFARILPHVEVSDWTECAPQEPGATWTSADRKKIRISLRFRAGQSPGKGDRGLGALVERRRVPNGVGSIARTLDTREHEICGQVARQISAVLQAANPNTTRSLGAIRRSFDEQVIADHLKGHHGLRLDLSKVLDVVGQLAQQTYENKALSFGCVLDPNNATPPGELVFPAHLATSKQYRALTDGFRTAYHVSSQGRIVGFRDLDTWGAGGISAKHFFPEWVGPLACASREGRCGIALTHAGDILIFDEGHLRFSYRFGRWQYWNHRHLVDLLHNLERRPV